MADLLELSYPAPNGCAPPNGSRLSCGRLARWRKDGGRVRCSPGHDTTGSFRTSAPVSFKRLLDGPTVWGRVAILDGPYRQSTRQHCQTATGTVFALPSRSARAEVRQVGVRFAQH